MGFTSKVASTALKQANNSLNMAVQLLQEEPDLIQLAAEEKKKKKIKVTDEMVANVVAMGFEPDMARIALRREGGVKEAVEALMDGEGVISDDSDVEENDGKRRKMEDK